MFVPIKFMLDYARKNNFAISRFLLVNLESIEAITNAAVRSNSPIIYDIYLPLMQNTCLSCVEYLAKKLGSEADIPVGLYSDHVDSVEECIKTIDKGYTGVMIDLSKYSLEENIKGSKEVVDYAHRKGVFVEGEVGTITTAFGEGEIVETDPDEASEYIKRTGVDGLGISIGVKSGFYDKEPEINYDLIRKLDSLNVHLVLHGTSGLSREMVRKCIDCGMTYTGYGTDPFFKYYKKIDEVRKQKGEKFIDFSKIIIPARDEMQREIEDKIDFLKSNSRGNEIIKLYKNTMTSKNEGKDIQDLSVKNILNCFSCSQSECDCGEGDVYLNELVKNITNEVLTELEEKK